MLLKHFRIIVLLSLCFFIQAATQTFKTGLIRLTSSDSQSLYTINEDSHLNQIIIVLSSFTSIQNLTSCFLTSRVKSQTNFTCTSNVESVSYLFYEKTPLIYSDVFIYYFSSNNQKTQAIWVAPIGLTIIQHPTVRAMLSGFWLQDSNYVSVQLQTINDSNAINISRTLNVKAINFSFILVQNYASYNLRFAEVPIVIFKKMVFQSYLSSALTFWGMYSINFEKVEQPNQVFFKINKKQSNNQQDFATIIQFQHSQNIQTKGIFLIHKEISNQSCTNFYNPLLQTCQMNCSSQNTMQWNTSNMKYQYCLRDQNQSTQLVEKYPNVDYTNNNLKDLLSQAGKGCSKPIINTNMDVNCEMCQSQYVLYNKKCACRLGFAQTGGICRQCQNKQCDIQLDKKHTLEDVDLNQVNIKIAAKILNNFRILQNAPKSYQQNITVNGKLRPVQISYFSQTQQLRFQISNVSKQIQYRIKFENSTDVSEKQLFYVQKNQGTTANQSQIAFLWRYFYNTTISASLSSTTILKKTSVITETSQKTIPLLFLIGILIGTKINAFSLFQTVSLIYLVNFIKLEQQYDDLRDLLKDMFIFQPRPFWNFLGNWNGLEEFIITDQVKYDQLIYKYTEGKLLLSAGFNSFICLLLQIIGFSLFVFLIKRILKQSPNQIAPITLKKTTVFQQNLNKKQQVSKINQKDWLSQPFPPKKTIRTRLYALFKSLQLKKYIHITPMILTQHLSFFFLALYQLTLPLFNFQAIISRIFCLLVITLIVGYPLLLLRYNTHFLLKCSSIFTKRSYNRGQSWLYFYLSYNESIIYGILLILLKDSVIKISCIVLVQALKLILFGRVLKRIEIVKIIALLFFFISILLILTLPVKYASILTEVSIFTVLLVLLSQFLKVLRGLTISVLNIFKEQQQLQKNLQKSSKQPKKQANSVFNHFQRRFVNNKEKLGKNGQKFVNPIKNQKPNLRNEMICEFSYQQMIGDKKTNRKPKQLSSSKKKVFGRKN